MIGVMSFARQEITIVTPSLVDDRGTERPDYDNPAARVLVQGCSVQPGPSIEQLGDREHVTVRWTVYAPPGVTINERDAVEFEGVRYSVDGRPLSWPSATGALKHTVISLVDWEG